MLRAGSSASCYGSMVGCPTTRQRVKRSQVGEEALLPRAEVTCDARYPRRTRGAPPLLGSGHRVLLGDLSRGPQEPEPKREEVEPYLAALLQAEHFNLLVGSGLTAGLSQLASFKEGADMGANPVLADGVLAGVLEAAARTTAEHNGRGEPNIEDRLRVAIAACEGLGYLGDDRAVVIQDAVNHALDGLRSSLVATEAALAGSMDEPVTGSMTLRGLLMTFLGSFAGRAPTRDRLHVFTTNYDRVIEWGAELAGLRVVDRFVGSLQPVFRSSRLEVDYHYSPPGTVHDPRHLDGVFRLTKLHGLLDWKWDSANRRVVRASQPFGAMASTNLQEMLIFPQSAKDVETTFYPYADLFRDLSFSLCRPHTASSRMATASVMIT